MRHNTALLHPPGKDRQNNLGGEASEKMFYKDKNVLEISGAKIFKSDVGIAFFMLPIFPEIHLCQEAQVKLYICC